MTQNDYSGKSLVEIAKGYPPSLPSPRREFILHLATITMKSENTVRNWLSGKFQPDALSQKVIADNLQSNISILFPECTR